MPSPTRSQRAILQQAKGELLDAALSVVRPLERMRMLGWLADAGEALDAGDAERAARMLREVEHAVGVRLSSDVRDRVHKMAFPLAPRVARGEQRRLF